jgi:hypothetical protein
MVEPTTDQPVITQENVVTKESDTKTVIGVSALSLPTPDRIKAVFKMLTFFTIVLGLVLNGVSTIPEDVKKQGLEYMGVIVLILQKAEDFWGVKIN